MCRSTCTCESSSSATNVINMHKQNQLLYESLEDWLWTRTPSISPDTYRVKSEVKGHPTVKGQRKPNLRQGRRFGFNIGRDFFFLDYQHAQLCVHLLYLMFFYVIHTYKELDCVKYFFVHLFIYSLFMHLLLT